MKKKRKKGWIAVAALVLLMAGTAAGGILILKWKIENFFVLRGHGGAYEDAFTFRESARELSNPYRGFYGIQGFFITDAETQYEEDVQKRFEEDDRPMALIEINIRNYAKGPISEEGLQNIERLFAALEQLDQNLIVRFMYDWDGKNAEVEPENIEIILNHMEQIAGILNRRKDQIFTTQGLFIGNWGEMNNTKYISVENLSLLAEKYGTVLDEQIFLAVRVPIFWRAAAVVEEKSGRSSFAQTLERRMGLYNDGMLASGTDLGTYGSGTKEGNGYIAYWNRDEELAFQEELCRTAPNGGETVRDNEYNDFENAVRDLGIMHVSYLNRDYDLGVLDKWAGYTVEEAGCFDGLNGLDYIERHLGYRILIDRISMDYEFEKDILNVEVSVQNVGFAPIYREAETVLLIVDKKGKEAARCLFEEDIRELSGGNQSSEIKTFRAEIPIQGWKEGTYTLYFGVRDVVSGKLLLFANESDPEAQGYRIGSVKLESAQDYLDQWLTEHHLEFVRWELPSQERQFFWER